MLSFKLVVGRFKRIKYGPTIEAQLRKHLEGEHEFFTERKAVPSIRNRLRTSIIDDIKDLIERETEMELAKTAIFQEEKE
jgi:hypothetical protein